MADRDAVIDAALRLPTSERARVVARIVESLSDKDEGHDAAWVAEVERRVEFEGGEENFVDLATAKAEIEKALRRQ
jgi:hypothetical protein